VCIIQGLPLRVQINKQSNNDLLYYSFIEVTTSKNKSTTLRTIACPDGIRKKARLNDAVGQALRKLVGEALKNEIQLLKLGYILHLKSPLHYGFLMGWNYFILAEPANFQPFFCTPKFRG
jgi:hypothetical protein